MNTIYRRTAGLAAALATAGMSVPVAALPVSVNSEAVNTLPHVAKAGWDEEAQTQNGWGRYRGWRRHRHRGIDGGDVLAGILVIGGAIAVAKAIENSNDKRDRRYPDRDVRTRYPGDDRDYRPPRGSTYRGGRYGDDARRGIDGAIDDCTREVERSSRVESVDTAERDGSGWVVEGETSYGRYRCEIDSTGRLRDIDLDERRGSAGLERREPRDSRYDDDYYADARSRNVDSAPGSRSNDGPGTATTQEWERRENDDRYETAKGPDYALAK